MPASSADNFATDRPLDAKEHDRLNRVAFAERLVLMLRHLPKGASLTVGIHGPWGDGKTTVLNLVRLDLASASDTVTVQFNPWRFTDESAMLRGFFQSLAGSIRAHLSTNAEAIAGWLEKVGGYVAWVDKRLESLVDTAATSAEPSLDDLRSRLSTALTDSGTRVVVLIDDIDRLDRHETHTLFRLIKACADFPNVSYVLAFDDVAVAKALGERYGSGDEQSGRSFLEKIIQVPLKLPAASRADLRSLCFSQIDAAIEAANIRLSDGEVNQFVRWFDQAIAIRLRTPRAAKRYGNALMFALPMLKGEVNVVDLLLVEALRTFFPDIYDILRDNHSEFSGVEPDRHLRPKGEPRAPQLLNAAMESLTREDADAVRALLIEMFPRLSSAYGRGAYTHDWLAQWCKERRISSPEYCPRYFAFAIDRNDISEVEMSQLLDAAATQDHAGVKTLLTKHLSGQRARQTIGKLRGIESDVNPLAAEVLAAGIASLGALLPNPRALFSVGEPPSQAAILVSHLLKCIPPESGRVAAAQRVMAVAEPLWFGAECMRWLYVTDKPEQQESNVIADDKVPLVRHTLVARIKKQAALGHPLFDPDVPHADSLLYEWWRHEGREPVQQHLISVFDRDPSQVIRFLRSQAPVCWTSGGTAPPGRALDISQIRNMGYIIDIDVLSEVVRQTQCYAGEGQKCLKEDTPKADRELVEQFMSLCVRFKQESESQQDGDDGAKGR